MISALVSGDETWDDVEALACLLPVVFFEIEKKLRIHNACSLQSFHCWLDVLEYVSFTKSLRKAVIFSFTNYSPLRDPSSSSHWKQTSQFRALWCAWQACCTDAGPRTYLRVTEWESYFVQLIPTVSFSCVLFQTSLH